MIHCPRSETEPIVRLDPLGTYLHRLAINLLQVLPCSAHVFPLYIWSSRLAAVGAHYTGQVSGATIRVRAVVAVKRTSACQQTDSPRKCWSFLARQGAARSSSTQKPANNETKRYGCPRRREGSLASCIPDSFLYFLARLWVINVEAHQPFIAARGRMTSNIIYRIRYTRAQNQLRVAFLVFL